MAGRINANPLKEPMGQIYSLVVHDCNDRKNCNTNYLKTPSVILINVCRSGSSIDPIKDRDKKIE